MVTVEYMIKAARRKNNAISRAMLRSCGASVSTPLPEVGAIISMDKYTSIAECMANITSPMDGRQ